MSKAFPILFCTWQPWFLNKNFDKLIKMHESPSAASKREGTKFYDCISRVLFIEVTIALVLQLCNQIICSFSIFIGRAT